MFQPIFAFLPDSLKLLSSTKQFLIFGEISPYHQSYSYKNVIMPFVRNFVLKAAKSCSKIFRKPMSLATNLVRLVVEGFLLPVIGCLGLVSLFRFDS